MAKINFHPSGKIEIGGTDAKQLWNSDTKIGFKNAVRYIFGRSILLKKDVALSYFQNIRHSEGIDLCKGTINGRPLTEREISQQQLPLSLYSRGKADSGAEAPEGTGLEETVHAKTAVDGYRPDVKQSHIDSKESLDA